METKKIEKYYTRSNGEQVALSTMETTHIKNAMAKKMEELFNSVNKTDFSKKLQEVNDLKEEYFARINKFYETLGDE
jgi:hypothetical protein